ncbi:HEAT repeat-containing protein 6-like [Acropora palmata]|uniref:HEAT repeat-containing protein 6-like n=1 Tax=Acropora palmata TaxID=6131 RepID=UPI003DA0D185
MSFRDDKDHWQDAVRRLLNLPRSNEGALVTNLNVILDELNSLDYATSVVENTEDGLGVLSKCCALVNFCEDDDFLVTKFCQLIVNLLSKQKIVLNQETVNVLVPFLVFSIKNCKKWALVNVLKALSSTLYENGSFCLEFADSLLGEDGVLVKLCRPEAQDLDMLCVAVQCIANICMSPTGLPDAVGIEDRIATNAFNLLLVLLQTSSPKLYGSEVAHFRVVNTVLRGFPHVLLHSCSGQRQNLAALLSVLKNFMFCGMPGYKPTYAERNSHKLQDIKSDDLSTVHLSTIPQKDRTYAMLSKKKKRRSNNKKPKHPPGPHSSSQSSTEWPSVDALTPKLASHPLSREGSLPKVATCSSSVDMPTPEFAVHSVKKLEKHGLSISGKTTDFTSMRSVMEGHTPNRGVQLNSTLADTRSLPVEELVPNRAETKGSQFGLSHSSKRSFNDTAQHIKRNVLGHNDDGVMSAGIYEKSEAESSGYQSATSLSAASSDSEYSDSEAGQIARLRSITSKVRLNVLLCLQAVIKSTDKKVLFGYWSSFVPDNSVSSSWSLFTTILKDPTPKGRSGGVAVLMDLLDGSRQFLVAAEDREQHSASTSSRPFTSFSVKLSGIVHELHRCLLQALMAETLATTKTQILKCLSILVLNSPYNRLKQGLLTKLVRQLKPLLSVKDPNLQTGALSCIRMVVCVHTPLPEVVELMRPTSAAVYTPNKGVSHISHSDPSERHTQLQASATRAAVSDFQVPPGSPWLVDWCAHAVNKLETSLVLRLEALQFLTSFVKSYIFLASSSVECLRNLACSCLKDSDSSITLGAIKLLEELARSLNNELSNDEPERLAISKEQVLYFWQELLRGPLTKILQDGMPASGPLCYLAVDCLSNVGDVILSELPVNMRMLCITLLLGLSDDDDKNVKASSIRALGVFVLYPCLKEDVLFVADTANKVLSAMTDQRLIVRMRAAWSLANISDSLVSNMSSENSAFMDDFTDMVLLKLLNTSITAADDHEKVKSNAVRALGNLLRYIRTASLEKTGVMEAVEKAVQALIRNVGFGLMKVRWNACYALGNLFRNHCLPIGSAPWTSDLFVALGNVICDCKNFKVRINAVIALSVPPERRYYGDAYSHVYTALIESLKGTEKITDFSEFKYRDTLRQQLCSSLCHMTILMTAEDSLCLSPVLKENQETYKGYMKEYARQLHTQELPVEDQTHEKTATEKLSSLYKAHRRVQEGFEPNDGAVNFLKDVFAEMSIFAPSREETETETDSTLMS